MNSYQTYDDNPAPHWDKSRFESRFMMVYIVTDIVATAVLIMALRIVFVLKKDVMKPTRTASAIVNRDSSCHLSGDDLLALSDMDMIKTVVLDINNIVAIGTDGCA